MDYPMEDEDIENIEQILRYFYDFPINLNWIECKPGSRQGDNYMSVIKRVFVKGKWKADDNDFKKYLIVKRQIPSKSRRELFRCDEAFNNEINVYCNLVPILKQYSKVPLPLPECIFAGIDQEGEIVVLEDLNDLGYGMADRFKGLDYQHCSVVMKELGSFHAISLAMKATQPELFDSALSKIHEIVYCEEAAEFYTHSLESSLREALSSLRTSNLDGQLDDVIGLIESKLSGKLYEIMSQHILENSSWNVIAHGDMWINNLMFRPTCDTNESFRNADLSVKIIDLQTIRYTSLCIDIIHLLYSSTTRQIRNSHYDKLIEDYHSALMGALDKYLATSSTGPNSLQKLQEEFSIENLKKETKRHMIYGLGICMWLLPAVTFHPDFIPDLDSMTLNDFTTCAQEKNIIEMHTDEYHRRMKDIALEFYQNNYLT